MKIGSYPLQRYLRDQSKRKQREYLPLFHQLRFAPTQLNVDVTDQVNVEIEHKRRLFGDISGRPRREAGPTTPSGKK